jgi:hypothetical protein
MIFWNHWNKEFVEDTGTKTNPHAEQFRKITGREGMAW